MMDPQDMAEFIASLQGKSDHDLLIAMNVQMQQVLERLEKGDKCMDLLDDRIGALERFQSTLLGIAASISIGISIVGSWVMSKISGGS